MFNLTTLTMANFECIALNKLKKKKKCCTEARGGECRVTSHETNAIHVILSYVNTNRE